MALSKIQGAQIETPVDISAVNLTGVTTAQSLLVVGSGTTSGTSDQPLQVFGGAYVSGSVGIGTTNISSSFEILTSLYPTAKVNSTYTSASRQYTSVFFGPQVANKTSTIGNVNDTVTPTNSFFHITPYGRTEGSSLTVNNTSGNIGFGTTTPDEVFHLGGASNKQIQVDSATTIPGYVGSFNDSFSIAVNRRVSDGTIVNSTRSAAFITLDGDVTGSKIIFNTINTTNTQPGEALRIDENKRILTGTTSSFCNDKVTIQTGGNSGSPGVIGIRNANATSGLAINGVLGTINFGARANEGDNYALITALVDGTPSSGTSYPGRLIFSTTGAGTTNPTERLRITESGNVGVNSTFASAQISIGHTTESTTLLINAGNSVSKGESPLFATCDRSSVSGSFNGWFLYDNNTAGDLQLYRKQGPSAPGTLYPVMACDRSQTQVAIGTDGFYPSSVSLYVRANNSSGDCYAALFGSNNAANYGLNGGVAIGANPTTGDGFVANLGGNNGLAFYTESTGGIFRVASRLSPTGIHTVGNQPAFYAVRSGTQTNINTSAVSTDVIIYNSAIQNIGGHYNTTTGLFTAPVAGRYVFSASIETSGVVDEFWWIINGGRSTTPNTIPANTGIPKAVDYFYLDAGDTIGIHPYDSGGALISVAANVYHTYFKGCLIC